MLRLIITRNINFLTKSIASTNQVVAPINSVTHNFNQLPSVANNRLFSISSARRCEATENEEGEDNIKVHPLYKKYAGTDRDRSQIIPYEKSVEYLNSPAFATTYGSNKVWELYRRVHKGQFPKTKTRKTCIRGQVIAVGSPCPICRDEFLVLDYRNLQLLKQFISPYTGEIESFLKTGLCQKQHMRLCVAIERAYDLGLLEFEVPFRQFDYSDYFDVYEKPKFYHQNILKNN